MKKAILSIWLLAGLLGVCRSGQIPEKITCATTFGTGIALSKPASIPFLWQVMVHYHPLPRFAIGIGSGVSLYGKPLIPLFADIRFMLLKSGKLIPFLELGAGYAFSAARDAQGGLYLTPSLGLRCRVHPRIRLWVSIGYELQAMKRIKSYSNPLFQAEFVESLRHHSLSFRLGLGFP